MRSIFEDVMVGVISYRRPDSAERMQEFHDDIVWCLADNKDVRDYSAAGVRNMVLAPDLSTTIQRNRLCDIADIDDVWICCIDDDLLALHEWNGPTREEMVEINLERVVTDIHRAMISAGASYGGMLCGGNPFYGRSRVHTHASVASCLTVVNPSAGMRWNEDKTIEQQDDWEMTLRNIDTVGQVARVDWLIGTFSPAGDPVRGYNPKGGMTKTYKEKLGACHRLLEDYPHLVKASSTPLLLKILKTKNSLSAEEADLYNKVNQEVKQNG